MNPQNGELMAMVNYPEFDLNDPFTLVGDTGESVSAEEKQNLLNKMWRNQCISDTYEPGSTFKIITAAAALEEGVVNWTMHFSVRVIKLWRTEESGVRERQDMERKHSRQGS